MCTTEIRFLLIIVVFNFLILLIFVYHSRFWLHPLTSSLYDVQGCPSNLESRPNRPHRLKPTRHGQTDPSLMSTGRIAHQIKLNPTKLDFQNHGPTTRQTQKHHKMVLIKQHDSSRWDFTENIKRHDSSRWDFTKKKIIKLAF